MDYRGPYDPPDSLKISKSHYGSWCPWAVALFEFRRINLVNVNRLALIMVIVELYRQQTLTEHLLFADFLRLHGQLSLEHFFDILFLKVVLYALLILVLVILFALVFLDSLGDHVLEGFDGLHSLSKHGLDVSHLGHGSVGLDFYAAGFLFRTTW